MKITAKVILSEAKDLNKGSDFARFFVSLRKTQNDKIVFMKLIIGLGNPGAKHEKNRHNFGFMAVDYLRSNFGAFSSWNLDKTANTQIAKGEISGEQIILAKPQSFMNLSGKDVLALAHFYKINQKDIWIVHDDFDLPLGIIRISQAASAGGHKGIKSIIEALGNKNFLRFRLGIYPIGKTFLSVIFKRVISLEKFVLKNFCKEEQKIADETIKKSAQAIEEAIKEGAEKAMNLFN